MDGFGLKIYNIGIHGGKPIRYRLMMKKE